VIIWKKILKIHISSSFELTKRLGRHFENCLGDYRVIITSTATNQRGELSIITFVIILMIYIARGKSQWSIKNARQVFKLTVTEQDI
jgi:hypothetical protein